MVKIKIKSIKVNPDIFGVDDRLWRLVSDIILEKWSLADGDFEDGYISEKLLRRISKVLRERMTEKYKTEIIERRNINGHLLGWQRKDKYKRLTEGCEALGKY